MNLILYSEIFAKYKPSVAITLQLFIEISFVVLIPSLIFTRDFETKLFFDYQTSVILAGIVGVIHLFAWKNNKKIITIVKNNPKFESK